MKPPTAGGAFVSGITPQSTTAQLAGQVPKESEKSLKGGSEVSQPETPFHDAQEFKVDPIPATSGIGNPVTLQPSEKVPPPSSLTKNTVNSTVTTDKASYEKGPGAAGQGQTTATQGGAFGVLPVTGQIIPESGLPMGPQSTEGTGPSVRSVGAGATTAALAGQVPKEPRGVPEVVEKSQAEAGVEPEASANPEAVAEKRAVEKELEGKLPKEAVIAGTMIIADPPTTNSTEGECR